MRIEDYWLDGELYNVSFETTDRRTVSKLIIVQSDGIESTEIENIEKIVRNRFKSVERVLKVDELDSCLILKGAG